MINALVRFLFLSYIDIGNTHCQEQLSFQNDIEVNTLENERNLETVSSCQFSVNLHLPFWVCARFKSVSICKQGFVGYLFSRFFFLKNKCTYELKYGLQGNLARGSDHK